MRKRYYNIAYLSHQDMIDELYSTFEVILLLIYSCFSKNVRILEIKFNAFCSDEEGDE